MPTPRVAKGGYMVYNDWRDELTVPEDDQADQVREDAEKKEAEKHEFEKEMYQEEDAAKQKMDDLKEKAEETYEKAKDKVKDWTYDLEDNW